LPVQKVIQLQPPLTFQKKKHNLSLSDLIKDEFAKTKYIDELKIEFEKIARSERVNEKATKKQKEFKIVQKMIAYYCNYVKKPYACISNPKIFML